MINDFQACSVKLGITAHDPSVNTHLYSPLKYKTGNALGYKELSLED